MKFKRIFGVLLAAVLAAESLPQTAVARAAGSAEQIQISEEAFGTDAEDASFGGVDVGLEIRTASVESEAGVYQEGAFGVLGGEPYRDELQTLPFAAEQDLSAAEEYLYQQLLARKQSIDLSAYNITVSQVRAFVFGVINDHPDLYFVRSGFRYSYSGDRVFSVTVEYLEGCDDEAFQSALSDALSAVDERMTDLEKALALHDYLVVNCEYDYENYLNDSISTYSYSAYGALVDRMAVCQGYALAYKLLCNRAGIECYMVSSQKMNHAWNLIRLDESYYQVDTTWDDPVWDSLGLVRHTNMFVSDEAFGQNHYDWTITSGSETVDLKAEDSRYDEAFWVDCDSPLILADGMCYYIGSDDSSGYRTGYGIRKRSMSDLTAPSSVILESIGIWPSSGGGYWNGAYSGLFRVGDRLYYNTAYKICSISMEGGEPRDETADLTSDGAYVYGSALCQWKVLYVLHKSPSKNEKETVLEASVDLGKRELNAPVFDPGSGTIDKGESVSLKAARGKIYYTINGETPAVTAEHTRLYTAPITVDRDMTIKAVAVSDMPEYADSKVAEAQYTACTNQLILASASLMLVKGDTKTLDIVQLPTTKTAEDIVWESSDPSVASVDDKGLISALEAGTATVTATAADHKDRPVTAQCEVRVAASSDDVRYRVVFEGWNGRVVKSEEVAAGGSASAPDIVAPEGYEFTGWDGSYENIRQDTVIRAQYRAVKYTIVYETGGGLNAADNPAEYTIETQNIILQPAYGRAGFAFAGWYRDEALTEGPVTVIEKGSTGDITLFARWRDERGLWLKSEGADEDYVIADQFYTGKAVKPAVEVYYGDTLLKAGADYSISYKNNTAANHLETDAEQAKAPMVMIRGKGNYTGTIYKTFKILRKNIADEDIQSDNPAVVCSGREIRIKPVLKWNGKKLSDKKDFTVEYPEPGTRGEDGLGSYPDAGAYAVQIKGCGSFTGTRTLILTIADPGTEILMGRVKAAKIPDQSYTGQPVVFDESLLALSYQKESLVLGQDYTAELAAGDDGISVGTHSVILTGRGKYVGEKRVVFRIKGIPMSTARIDMAPSLIYSGEALELDCGAAEGAADRLVITDREGRRLAEGRDFTLSYSNNRNVGTAKLKITGAGRYSGSVTKSFKITAYPLSEGSAGITAGFAGGNTIQPYEAGGAKPKVRITFRGRELAEGTDYTLSYANNTSVTEAGSKEPVVTVKGKKNFSGSRSLTFRISRQSLSEASVYAPDLEENAKAGKFMSKPVLTDRNGKKLRAGTDYEKTFVYLDENGTELKKADTVPAGSVVTVVITGKGNYTGTARTTFRIVSKGRNLSKASVKINRKIYYTGEKITLSKADITVKIGKTELSESDYEIVESSYVNNLKKGSARVTIRGKGEYGGTRQVKFSILSQVMKWWEKLL